MELNEGKLLYTVRSPAARRPCLMSQTSTLPLFDLPRSNSQICSDSYKLYISM